MTYRVGHKRNPPPLSSYGVKITLKCQKCIGILICWQTSTQNCLSLITKKLNKYIKWHSNRNRHESKYYRVQHDYIMTIFTEHFGGPRSAISPVCECLCIRKIAFKQNDCWPRYLTRWFVLIISRSSSKIKVIGQISHNEERSFFGMDEHYDVTCFGLFVELFVLKWSVRPRVRALSLKGCLVWSRLLFNGTFLQHTLSLSPYFTPSFLYSGI